MGRGRKETCWLKETAPARQPRERYLAGGCGGAWHQRLELEVHSSRSKSYVSMFEQDCKIEK